MMWSVFLLLISFAWADCTVSVGGKKVTYPDGKTVSLTAPGGSLENFTAQNQGPLGTCFANSVSVALKSALIPDHPNISYTHAAIVGNADVAKDKFWGSRKDDDGEEKDFTYGGYQCETIEALKKAGGACPQQFSVSEKYEVMGADAELQGKAMEAVAKYFDSVNAKDGKSTSEIVKGMEPVFEKLRALQSQFQIACEEEKQNKFPVSEALTSFLSSGKMKMLDPSPCDIARKALQDSLMVPDPTLHSWGVDMLSVKKEISIRFQTQLEGDPALSAELDEFFNSDKEPSTQLNAKVKAKISQFMSKLLKDSGKEKACGEDELVKFGAEKFVLTSMKSAKNKKCDRLDTASNGKYRDIIFKDPSLNSCIAPINMDAVMGLLDPLIALGAKLDDGLWIDLMNPYSVKANQILSILTPECKRSENLVSLNGLSCKTDPVCPNSNVELCKINIGTIKDMFRSKALDNIGAGRALPITICTSFLTGQTEKSDFCRKKLPGIKGHSFHAITMTGYRCHGEKIEYELLNSWGADSCPAPRADNATECQKGTGRFWVTEDVLVDNTAQTHEVKPIK